MENRRQLQRLNLARDDGVTVESADGQWNGPVRNISLGGIFVQCRPTGECGSPVRLRLILPGGEAHEADCVIRFTISSGAGLEFINPTDAMRQAIQVLFSERECVP